MFVRVMSADDIICSAYLVIPVHCAILPSAGGGVAIGLGLTGDFMVDTAFGELPSPVVATMATQGAHGANPANIAAQTGKPSVLA